MKTPPKAIADFIKSTPDNIKPIVCAQAMIYAAIPFDYSSTDSVSPFLKAVSANDEGDAELCIRVCGAMDYVVGKSSGGFGGILEEKAIEMGSDVLGSLAKEQPSKDAAFALAKASWQILRDNDLSIPALQKFEAQQMAKRLPR